MIKNILSFAMIAVLLVGAPSVLSAEPFIEITDNMSIDTESIKISVNQSVLHVSGASGQIMKIYNVAGVCVMTVKVDGDDKRYDLNLAKGCYIVKVSKVVRKISIR
jgi:hypothetical protein